MSEARSHGWLPLFRRAAGYLRPHRRNMVIGLAAAAGVSLFYTFSVSSVVPVLKIIFAEHEGLVAWVYRAEAQRRLGIVVPGDLPDNPNGLLISDVRPNSRMAGRLRAGDRLVRVNGQTASSYAISQTLATTDARQILAVVVGSDDLAREVTLELASHRGWWPMAQRAAQVLPAGRTPDERFRALALVMVGVIVITTLGGVCRFFNEGLVAIAVQRAMHDLRTALADHALRLPLQWHTTQPPGDVLSRFATDISKVEVGLSTLFGKVIREPLKAMGVLALTLLLDWHMLVVGAIGLPIGAVVIRVLGRLVKRAQRRASLSWGRLLDHLGERLSGIRVVKAYNMQAAEGRRFSDEDSVLTRAQTHIELVDAAGSPALEMLASIAITGFILYGGSRVFAHELEPHLLFGAVICLGGIFDPLRKMGNVYNRLQAAEASARRLFEILDLPAEEIEQPDAGGGSPAAQPVRPDGLAEAKAAPVLLRERIVVREVSFSYPTDPNRLVLDRVSLEVHRGQVVALVGPNGSGKTTLVSLLLRFFEPTSGEILIDGRRIADLPLADVRRQFGLVTQESVIFSDTVRGNIAYGANGVSEEAMRRASGMAHVDEFVRDLRVEHDGQVTTGYDARISGRTLSGGQRQRIMLARAILRDPPILILDEATSQVDSESERKIQEALDEMKRDRTVFVIAHRFSTIASADLIIVLDAGRVVGMGQHDALLATCPPYAALVRTQFAG